MDNKVIQPDKYVVGDLTILVNNKEKTLTLQKAENTKCSAYDEEYDFKQVKKLLSFAFDIDIV